MKNLHYLFNTEYYSNLGTGASPGYKALNGCLTGQSFAAKGGIVPFTDDPNRFQHFALTTLYPGLLMGLGYPHSLGVGESGKNEAIKLGFSLDYATGLPVIPGSTIKGILRSFFSHEEAWPFIASKCGISTEDEALEEEGALEGFITSLCDAIFEGKHNGEAMPMASRDVFFDALPIKPEPIKPDKGYRLFGLEYITPHYKGKESAPEAEKKLYAAGLKDPVPLKLLKVRPGITFLFRFSLKPCTLKCGSAPNKKVSGKQKRDLFKAILLITGVGAKTNVGFGSLEDDSTPGPYHELVMTKTAASSTANPPVKKVPHSVPPLPLRKESALKKKQIGSNLGEVMRKAGIEIPEYKETK